MPKLEELVPYLPPLPEKLNQLRSAAIFLKETLQDLTEEEKETLALMGAGAVTQRSLKYHLYRFVGSTHRISRLLQPENHCEETD